MALLIGCTKNSIPTQQLTPQATPTPCLKTVNIISEPSGSIIEVDDDIRGKTPLSLTFECPLTPNQQIAATLGYIKKSSDPGHHTIRALPTRAGECLQSKLVFTDKLPQNILFQMALCPIQPRINLYTR